jgi:hypothetical protein
MNHTINLEWEQLESIMRKEIANDLKYTLEDLDRVMKTGKGFVYSFDKDEDIEELTTRAAALAVVLSYYGG